MNEPSNQPAAVRLRLRVSAGPAAGAVYPLSSQQSLVLGRERTATPELADDGVSRRHAEVHLTADGPELTDLGSSNGTYVNVVRVDGFARLGAGDRVRIGSTELVVEDVGA